MQIDSRKVKTIICLIPSYEKFQITASKIAQLWRRHPIPIPRVYAIFLLEQLGLPGTPLLYSQAWLRPNLVLSNFITLRQLTRHSTSSPSFIDVRSTALNGSIFWLEKVQLRRDFQTSTSFGGIVRQRVVVGMVRENFRFLLRSSSVKCQFTNYPAVRLLNCQISNCPTSYHTFLLFLSFSLFCFLFASV